MGTTSSIPFVRVNMGRLKTREWKTRDGQKVTLENAGHEMQDWKTRECPL